MKRYINTSNYYLSTITTTIDATSEQGTIDIADISVDWVTLPLEWYYWVDVDFSDTDKREIFRITKREWYVLTYDKRISPNDKHKHSAGASVALRDFSELFNALSRNSDNFWEVEQTGNFTLKVYWGKAFVSGKEYKDIEDATLTFPASSDKYIEYNLTTNTFDIVDDYNVENYLLARVVSNAVNITSVYDYRSIMVNGWGIWDMQVTVYDPDGVMWDAFSMDNMKQWENNKYVTPEQIQWWDEKQDELLSWTNIKTINWQSLLWPGDVSLQTVLSVAWEWERTLPHVQTHHLQHTPYNDNALMIFTDSGTALLPVADYTYDSTTNTITFINWLLEDECATIWVMVTTWSVTPPVIWEGKLKIKVNGQLLWTFWANDTADKVINVPVWEGRITFTKEWEVVKTISVNQSTDETVEVGWDVGKADITITQWPVTVDTFNVNATENKTINFPGDVFVTQDEYEDLPDTKLTDWNNYFIYHE